MRLEICTGTDNRTLFSIRPDRAGICEMTFPSGIRQLARGWTTPTICENPEEAEQQ
jgi:hypothetical protein